VSTFDVAIVGGGLIGASIAFELGAEGLRVVILDRQEPGRESSWAAAGMLSPGPDSLEESPLAPLGKESLRLYPEFIAAVEGASGRSTSFLREGTMEIFFGDHAEGERDSLVAAHRRLGLAAEPISADAARELERSLGPAARAAAWLPEEAMVDPRLLMEAVLAGAQQRGVEIRSNCAVTSFLNESHNDGRRCTGVAAGNESFASKFVVLAAGSYTGTLEKSANGFRLCAPTHPVRGQMLALRPKGVSLRRVLRSKKGYVVPRRDGRIVAGSTLENAGFEKHVTPDGLQTIWNAALKLVPELAGAEVVEAWAGLRPGTPDNLPILGPTDIEGLLVATGHYRNGILLAPVTAKLIRDWIVRGQVNLDTKAFSPSRFSDVKAESRASQGARTIP
jgi:glycine oxidase